MEPQPVGPQEREAKQEHQIREAQELFETICENHDAYFELAQWIRDLKNRFRAKNSTDYGRYAAYHIAAGGSLMRPDQQEFFDLPGEDSIIAKMHEIHAKYQAPTKEKPTED